MTSCIVSGQRGMQNSTMDKVKTVPNMKKIDVTFSGGSVSCIYFENPKNAWYNKPASIVTGKIINGSAIIIGTTVDQIIQAQQREPRSWTGFARELPKTVPLDELARARIQQAAAERGAAWRDYHERKAIRKQCEKDPEALTAEEEDAANQADADFAEFMMQEEFAQSFE